MRRIAVFLLAALIPVAAGMLVLMSMQDELLFPTTAVPPAGRPPNGAEPIVVRAATGETLHGVHLRPAKEAVGPKTLILGFGGNAWNGQHVAEYLHEAFPQADVVAFHYRGYQPSTGTPSADALIEDAPLVLRASMDRVKPERTVAVGFSIGSGVAASLAATPGVDGLILVTPFDSLKAVAAGLYPWLPIGPFFRHEIDTAAMLGGSQIPVAIVAAEKDDIISSARTEALRRRVANLRFDRTIAGVGHNDIYGHSEFRQALLDAFDAVARK